MTLQELNDQLVVVAAIQQKQTEIQKLQAEEIYAIHGVLAGIRKGMELHELRMQEHGRSMQEHDRRMEDHDRRMEEHDRRMADLDVRIEKLVSGFGAYLREHR